MAISLSGNFNLVATLPLDARTIKPTIADRNAIDSGQLYEGLIVFVEETNLNYQWVDNAWITFSVQGVQGMSVQGTQGLQGRQGTQGMSVQGVQGLQGRQGTQGMSVQGLQGMSVQGLQGMSVQGLQGVQGMSVQGLQGIQGTQGMFIQGSQGLQGMSVQGAQGMSIQGAQGMSIQGSQGMSIQGVEGRSIQGVGGTSVVLKGSVATVGDLPNPGSLGDLYIVLLDGCGYVSDGANGWTNVGVIQGPQGVQGMSVQGTQGLSNQGVQGVQGTQGMSVQGAQGLSNQGVQGGLNSQGIQGSFGIQGAIGGGETVSSITSTGTVNGVTLTGGGTGDVTLTLGGAISINYTEITGRIPIDHAANAATYGYSTSVNAGHVRKGNGITVANGTFSLVSSVGSDGTVGTIVVGTNNIGVSLGTTNITACAGDDDRLIDARTPKSHTHGNITNVGAMSGIPSGRPLITTAGGVITTTIFGTTAGSVCEGDDNRLDDPRDPNAHTLLGGSHTVSSLDPGQVMLATGASSFGFVTMTGDATISSSGVLTLDQYGVTLDRLQVIDTDTILGTIQSSYGHGVVSELTTAQVTAMLNVFVSGQSPLKGLVPPPSGATGTVYHFLNGTGTWTIPPDKNWNGTSWATGGNALTARTTLGLTGDSNTTHYHDGRYYQKADTYTQTEVLSTFSKKLITFLDTLGSTSLTVDDNDKVVLVTTDSEFNEVFADPDNPGGHAIIAIDAIITLPVGSTLLRGWQCTIVHLGGMSNVTIVNAVAPGQTLLCEYGTGPTLPNLYSACSIAYIGSGVFMLFGGSNI
jgi:hypothetical protein